MQNPHKKRQVATQLSPALSPYKNMITEIQNLRTYETQDVVNSLFDQVMQAYEDKDIDKNELIQCFHELADQQYHQYEPMPIDKCNNIERWSLKTFDLSNQDDVNTLIPLAHSLAFTIDTVQNIASGVSDADLKNEFTDMLKNTKENRINPYWDLEKLSSKKR
ncbi:MAG: hypothetical protein D8M62_09035 [Proteobacteria bacterium]|nr:hypothetical protein [Pseudomonadota bacterium]